MGATPGFISIMHTWGSDLSYHPHIHVLSTSGGLDANRNWHEKRNGFFLPGKAIARLFKGKFLSGLKGLHESGKLCYEGSAARYRNPYEYQELLDICYGKHWVTDIRESFAGAETGMHYLGRYTHRIAISNSRIVRMDESTVTFKVKDYKNGGIWKELTIDGKEFVRRFLMHVPPKNFVRIRHYGLLGNHNKRKMVPICRNLIGCREFLRRFRKNDKVQAVKVLYLMRYVLDGVIKRTAPDSKKNGIEVLQNWGKGEVCPKIRKIDRGIPMIMILNISTGSAEDF